MEQKMIVSVGMGRNTITTDEEGIATSPAASVTISTIKKFIAFNEPDLGEEEIKAVSDVIRSGWIGTGKVSHEFEEAFANYFGGGYAVAVSSCTIGLQAALSVIESDSEDVITSPLTFAATVNSILNAGFNPILSDVDESGCLDPSKLKIDDKVAAIIPVHYSGNVCEMGAIREMAGKIPIIEDCAHAFGSLILRTGDFQVFSFYPNKNITCGEGGMVLTRDKVLADMIRVLTSQGLSNGAWARFGDGPIKSYQVEDIGMKGNLPDILAAIGLVQLRRWPNLRHRKTIVWDVYCQAFGEMPINHSMHFYPLRIKNRDFVRNELNKKGIGTGIHYKPLHLEPAYEFLGYKKGDFPEAESWGEEELSLPVSPKMTEDDAFRIVDAIKELTKGD